MFLGKSWTQFTEEYSGDNNDTYLLQLLWDLNELMYMRLKWDMFKHSALYLLSV